MMQFLAIRAACSGLMLRAVCWL